MPTTRERGRRPRTGSARLTVTGDHELQSPPSGATPSRRSRSSSRCCDASATTPRPCGPGPRQALRAAVDGVDDTAAWWTRDNRRPDGWMTHSPGRRITRVTAHLTRVTDAGDGRRMYVQRGRVGVTPKHVSVRWSGLEDGVQRYHPASEALARAPSQRAS
jgi:hypothetical protein